MPVRYIGGIVKNMCREYKNINIVFSHTCNLVARVVCVVCILFATIPCFAGTIFDPDEPIQDNLPVVQMSETFADIYEKLDSVKFAGKNINVAIESLEKLNPSAHIAATDERVVLVWGDSIIANYPRPAAHDWNAFGEITTALILKMREMDLSLHSMGENDIYQNAVAALMHGVDENGQYIMSRAAAVENDNRLLTSVGLTGVRDARGNMRVTGVFRGASADNADIRTGDIIDIIKGRNVSDMSDDEMDAAIAGFNSGTVKMHILTPAGNRNVVLRRTTVVAADADIIHRAESDSGVGILEIIIHRVSDGSVAIVNEALAKYENIGGIILDMRNASGDDERAAAKMAGLFIGAKPIMRIQETAQSELEVVPGGDAVTDAHVVVLVSNTTRGTAEAIAYAFYENDRGVLVGTPTAGAARIATQINLKNGGALSVMNKSLKTGSGRALDGRGVFPIVCLANIRSNSQQNAFFLNVINRDFNAVDYNTRDDIDADTIRRGCPNITSGTDEDALSAAVASQILTDDKIYIRLRGAVDN